MKLPLTSFPNFFRIGMRMSATTKSNVVSGVLAFNLPSHPTTQSLFPSLLCLCLCSLCCTRVATYGEQCLEVAPAWFEYGRALLLKEQESPSDDLLGAVAAEAKKQAQSLGDQLGGSGGVCAVFCAVMCCAVVCCDVL